MNVFNIYGFMYTNKNIPNFLHGIG